MSVTFSGGITFTGGGFSFTAAPPTTGTAGWFGGGNGLLTTIDRITFATDTAAASVRGPLSAGTYKLGATGNFTYGWFGGGILPGSPPGFSRSTVQRVTYATDTATASVTGPLATGRRGLTATGNTTNGWFGGGYNVPSPNGGVPLSTVDRITYATDTATATAKGPLSLGRRNSGATSDNSTNGWFGGGNTDAGSVSTVDRITFATDTTTASVRGPLSSSRYFLSALGNASYGWFVGGFSPYSTTVDRIDYSNDTTTASVRGPLNVARRAMGTAGSLTDGWVGAGQTSPGPISSVDRITYATDTATATARGALSSARYGLAGAAGIQ